MTTKQSKANIRARLLRRKPPRNDGRGQVYGKSKGEATSGWQSIFNNPIFKLYLLFWILRYLNF